MTIEVVLRSNSGFSSIHLEFSERDFEACGEQVMEARVRLVENALGGVRDYEAEFVTQHLLFSVAALRRFERAANLWLEEPFERFDPTGFAGEFDFRVGHEEGLVLEFGPKPHLISDRKPVVAATVKIGYVRTEQAFVTDQTCIGAFAADLVVALGDAN